MLVLDSVSALNTSENADAATLGQIQMIQEQISAAYATSGPNADSAFVQVNVIAFNKNREIIDEEDELDSGLLLRINDDDDDGDTIVDLVDPSVPGENDLGQLWWLSQ